MKLADGSNTYKIAARYWYGRHATGSVVIVDGHCAFHGKPSEATAFLKKIMERQKEQSRVHPIFEPILDSIKPR